MSKKRDTSKKRRRKRADPSGVMAMMDPNDPVAGAGVDAHGAAAIPPVTEEMMQHAARAAAELADGVARGQADLAEASRGVAERAASAAAPLAEAGREAFERGASAAADAAEEVAARSTAGALGQYNAKLLDALRANMEAAGAHAAALAQAKSLPEAVAINADHIRRQVEALTGQGRELSALAQRALFEAMQPFKSILPRG